MKFMENINVNIKNANLDMEVLETVEAPYISDVEWGLAVGFGFGLGLIALT